MQALETLLSSQLAAWHNRHPLARHVRPQDVHTMGVVALPFMRSGPPREPQEPVLGDLSSTASAPSFTQPPEPGLLQRLLAWRPGRKAPRDRWPVFSEQFVVGVTAAQAGEFARRYGYSQRPDDGSFPLRNIPVDEALADQGSADGAGAWPEEIYLLSAALDAGSARTRVLVAQGAGLRLYIRGPRCLHPVKVGLFGLVMALLLGVFLMAAMGSKKSVSHAGAEGAAQVASSAASAASATHAPTAAAGHDAHAASATEPASAPEAAASLPGQPPAAQPPVLAGHEGATTGPASSGPAAAHAASATPPAALPAAAASAPKLMTASQLPDNMASAPDIRPRLVPRAEGSAGRGEAPAGESARPGSKEGRDGAREPGKAASREARATDEIIERAHSSGVATKMQNPSRSAGQPASAPARGDGKEAKDGKAGTASKPEPPQEPPSAADTLRQRPGKSDGKEGAKAAGAATMVALVGPALPSKAEAEAYLQKMQPMIQPLVGKRPLELQVIQTPEGWRAAAWPFPSREEAQLINAMLVARGLRTRAVDF